MSVPLGVASARGLALYWRQPQVVSNIGASRGL